MSRIREKSGDTARVDVPEPVEIEGVTFDVDLSEVAEQARRDIDAGATLSHEEFKAWLNVEVEAIERGLPEK